ncbi:calcium/sodium antiporter [Aureisphaera galaxeae]|uniref:calcium/sodium antiporter n=1 Tax=Aureisphaera galaxeae TaxID=1538023 RepID=UPI00235061BB|nr:calcium/sodium antiporter [Aureisphaera galaxeae]MDC8006190.1 calcium/sodium antiporter [Aureisphaera galaxeae]
MSVLYILLGLTLLVVGGEFLVRASVALSFKLNLSRMVIGLTVVSFATSAPELLVSVQAAMDGYSSISLGNVIGSNIANIGLVLGITAVIAPLAIDKDFYKFNWPVMMLLSIALYFLLNNDNQIDTTEGIALVLALITYLWILIARARKANKNEVSEEVDDTLAKVSGVKIFLWLVIGGLALWGGSELLVKGAVDLAQTMGVSEGVIAVTMIAVGTSVPELAASVIAALKKEKALSLGNLIGSNIFNIASVLGITAIIQPISMMDETGVLTQDGVKVLTHDIFWMVGFAAVLIPLAFLPKRFSIGRYKGLLIVIAYAVFVSLAFIK